MEKKVAKENFICGLVEGEEVVKEVEVKEGEEYEIVESNYSHYYYRIMYKGQLLEVSMYDIA